MLHLWICMLAKLRIMSADSMKLDGNKIDLSHLILSSFFLFVM